MKLFTDKYQPKSSREIQHNQEAILKLKECIKNNQPVLLHGPTGNGKTISIYAIANDLNYEILELNASDLRNSESIEETLGNSLNQKSLFYDGKIILVDEIDGLSGKEDRGGVQALLSLLKNTNFPIVLTCNNPWDSKLSAIRTKSKMIEFKKLDSIQVFRILKQISIKENVNIKDSLLMNLAQSSKGDLRAAINDLQFLNNFVDLNEHNSREKKETIFNIMKSIFKSKDKEVLRSLEKLDMGIDEVFLWLDENLPLEYRGKDLTKAYDILSKADVFRGRIINQQHWRFLAYVNDLITAGIAFSKSNINNSFTSYKRASRILKLWKAKQLNTRKKLVAEKIAKLTHTSSKKIIKDMPYYITILNEDSIKQLKLGEEEIGWLNNTKVYK
ncbi:MAG: replication factor C large subunit [Nanoarchaeota archaeon]